MMTTQTAIIITQLPIAIAILFVCYEMHLLRKNLVELLRKLSKK